MVSPAIVLGAVGDISFKGHFENNVTDSICSDFFSSYRSFDLIVGNLESPLTSSSAVAVPGKCTLRGALSWAEVLKKQGISLVCLANNHLMDYGEQGLFETLAALDAAGVQYVGAGRDKEKACAPVFKDIAGRKFAFLACSSVEVSSRCYAESNQPGVAFLEEEELVASIKRFRCDVDIIVLMVHWGLEHYHYPTPQQRELARKLVAAGADIILGHHPHVLQGEEQIGKALVSYSSGNFLFDEFSWSYVAPDGSEHVYQSTLSEANRQAMMLKVTIPASGEISTNQIFTRISSEATVEIDRSPQRQAEYDKFCTRLHLPYYDHLWRLYALKREWDLRLSQQLSPGRILKKIHKIRPRHFKELMDKVRRSSRVSSGKSTNPYE